MPKTTIAPIVAVIVLVLQRFGITIDDTLQGVIVDWAVTGLAIGTAVWGIWKNHQKV